MRSTLMLLTLIAIAGCNRPQPPDTRTMLRKSLHGVLVYPRSTLVDVTSGSDAAQVTLTTLDSVAVVASWFRQELNLNGWALQSDVTSADGSIAIVAQKGSRPLWITLRPNVGGPGSTYTVIGAVVSGDSMAVAESGAVKPPAR
ncbi:MAG TPA: hypothetical protein VFP39_16505 [Gemmatimonadales bacterium]|nr:hypothetical protein [Gemmatimonadales bacterium]